MTKEITLTRGMVAIVDDDDFEYLSQWKWCAQKLGKNWYATRSTKIPFRKAVLMHREIMKAPNGVLVDHRNENGLDNRRQNLRYATQAQNLSNRGKQTNNTSGYKGVGVDKERGGYRAHIKHQGRTIFLGRFLTAKEAALAYDAAARKYFGEFAHLNFP